MTMRLYGSVRLVNSMPPDIQDGLATSTFWAPKIWRTSWIRNRLMPQVASSVSSGRPYSQRITLRSSAMPTSAEARNATGTANAGYQSISPGA